MRYLAFVEKYHPDRGAFTLHGPIFSDSDGLFSDDLVAGQPQIAIEHLGRPLSELEENRRRYATVRQAIREGQGRFRERLLDAYGGACACTGCNVDETLQAARIVAYRGQRSNSVDNGLLLRADLRLLFDGSLVTMEPGSYEVVASARLAGTEYEGLRGRRLRVPRKRGLAPNPDYLAAHYRKFRQLEGTS